MIYRNGSLRGRKGALVLPGPRRVYFITLTLFIKIRSANSSASLKYARGCCKADTVLSSRVTHLSPGGGGLGNLQAAACV
jgi:hypothetical protein